jgi:nucleoside-diphosphate-sugar epimerase
MKKIKTAIMTGGSGYIGKHVTKNLLLDGWQIVHLIRKKPKKEISDSKIKYINIKKKFLNPSLLKSLDKKKTIFIHLASYQSSHDEVNNFQKYINSNIVLGTKLLSFMYKNSFNKLIISESYWQFNQQGELFGNSIYSQTKSCFSMIAKYFSKNYNFLINYLVLYDVYGPDDNRKKIINEILNHKKNKTLKLTLGKQIMDYTFIDDVATGFVIAANKMLLNKKNKFIRNTVRSMQERSFKKYIKSLEKTLDLKLKIKWGGKKYLKNQIFKPWLPNSKWLIKSWFPKYNFEHYIKKFKN